MKVLIFCFPLLLAIGGCLRNDRVIEFNGMTMGATYSVKLAHGSSVETEFIKRQVSDILRKVNLKMSTYMDESDISELNQLASQEPYRLDPWFYEVLNFSLLVARLTNGSYDPTVGPLVNLWGFGPNERRALPTDDEIKRVKENIGFDKLIFERKDSEWYVKKLQPKLYVDLSSSAKGFAVDKIAEFLMDEDIKNFFIEVGGEIRAGGDKFGKNWVVAIERPDPNQRAVYRSFPLKNMSIATSGSYRNFFKSGSKTYSHTIDAALGKPIEHKMVSVTVLNESCMKADAFATALMVLGPEKSKGFAEENNLAVYYIYNTGTDDGEPQFSTHMSKAFKKINPMIE